MRMVERVADAIFEKIWPTAEWDESECRAVSCVAARAAIAAMRDPTDEMWAAAWLIYHPWGVNAPDPRDRPNAFDAMKEKTSAILAAMTDKALEVSQE